VLFSGRPSAYRGRFAPSPTGPLHFGSLIAALGSCLDARRHGGEWLVRIEDLDRQREVPGAADHIMRTLEAFGFAWDGPLLYQSSRLDAYANAIERLDRRGLLYPCGCSRTDIARRGRSCPEGPVYPGTCRAGLQPGRRPRSLRIHTDNATIQFGDRVRGYIHQDLERDVGDFVLRRADGIHAYQLAVVVDDAYQGITRVVRGADLMLSTPRQIYLQRCLGLPTPEHAHLPLALDVQGRKLSKSEDPVPLDPRDPLSALLRAWTFLGQAAFAEPPASLAEFWNQAVPNWREEHIPMTARRPSETPNSGLRHRPSQPNFHVPLTESIYYGSSDNGNP
jgi:glutamyl-Q tRNA(Asp) synthetase